MTLIVSFVYVGHSTTSLPKDQDVKRLVSLVDDYFDQIAAGNLGIQIGNGRLHGFEQESESHTIKPNLSLTLTQPKIGPFAVFPHKNRNRSPYHLSLTQIINTRNY